MFLAVARHQSFRRAASELGVTPSAAGQAVRALETRLGVSLFSRTTRSVGLTEAGERFLIQAEPAYLALVAAGAAASDLGGRPAGLLRLTMPRAVLPMIIRPILSSFSRAYPDIELEIDASDELLDISSKGFDAGIRMGQFIASDMTAIRLSAPFRMVTVASPGYLNKHGIPVRPEDLQRHSCIRLRRSSGGAASWRFFVKGKPLEIAVQGPLITSDFPTILDAAIDSIGMAQLPEPVAAAPVAEGKLKHVLAAFAPKTPGVFLYYPNRNQVMPKLRAFINHLKSNPTTTPLLD